MKLLMIDNYDSFTYNLVQYLGELGAEVDTHRNDAISLDDIRRMKPAGIVLSPGPCTPDQAGICLDVLKTFAEDYPILGVCLGHQAIGQAFGGKVVRAREVMHGKTSPMHHANEGVFAGLPNPMEATRYHSLIVERESLPDCLIETAWTVRDGDCCDNRHDKRDGNRDEIMGFRHASLPIEGVQFHPESILTRQGHELLKNFLDRL